MEAGERVHRLAPGLTGLVEEAAPAWRTARQQLTATPPQQQAPPLLLQAGLAPPQQLLWESSASAACTCCASHCWCCAGKPFGQATGTRRVQQQLVRPSGLALLLLGMLNAHRAARATAACATQQQETTANVGWCRIRWKVFCMRCFVRLFLAQNHKPDHH